MPLIDFIGAGPQRTGSSWLDAMLRQHPQVALPRHTKETFFWDKRFGKGTAWYARRFPPRAPGVRCGEIAPTLFPSEAARQRIARENPGCRIILLLRDPVERALSHYRHELALGLQRPPLPEAVRRDPRIVEASRYSVHIPEWQRIFGPERVRCLDQASLRLEGRRSLARICRFLGIDPGFPFEEVPPLSGSVRVKRPRLARATYSMASCLRSAGADRVVSVAKRFVPRFVYWESAAPGGPSAPDDVAFLEERLAEEIDTWRNWLPGDVASNKSV